MKRKTFKAICASIAAILLVGDVLGQSSASSVKDEEKIILLSAIEWDVVKKAVDNTNFYHIASQNATIIVTNGIPDIDLRIAVPHWQPIGRMPVKLDNARKRSLLVESQDYIK